MKKTFDFVGVLGPRELRRMSFRTGEYVGRGNTPSNFEPRVSERIGLLANGLGR